jgi:hypothetical protein
MAIREEDELSAEVRALTLEGFLALPFRFERRRYGTQFYCWVYVTMPSGDSLSLGDPWPQLTPKKSEILQAMRNEWNSEREEAA